MDTARAPLCVRSYSQHRATRATCAPTSVRLERRRVNKEREDMDRNIARKRETKGRKREEGEIREKRKESKEKKERKREKERVGL